jgi:glycosyltransferase involved in cell wall biosynthesis
MTFSIITITYNAAQVLQRTLDSVRSQTFRDFEHLIIDGASTDGTLDLLAGYDATVVSEPDRGIYDAMNKGLRMAKGDYVVFMNAGDTFHDAQTLQRVAAAIIKNRKSLPLPAVLYGDTDIVDAEGRFLRPRHLSAPRRLTWRSFQSGMLVCHQAFYALTAIARQTPYDLQYRHSADVDWCIRVMKEAERQRLPLVRVPGVVADFLDGGDSTRNHCASLRERFQVMRRHYGLLTTLAMHLRFLLRAVVRHSSFSFLETYQSSPSSSSS